MSESFFVLDASMTLAWCFEEEAGTQAETVLDMFTESQAIVPALWLLEISNALINAERRGCLTAAEGARFLELLRRLPIQIEETSSMERTWGDVLNLARAHQLSTYDACYLDLAMRSGTALATLDTDLKNAAQACGVPTL
ncbi:MAG: type II toxin-antitoxin system VapC family toxin [Anaerolineales bacterium]|jgi:predicted nucleic acid-binding protein|nr:type II toxin-antitoxin system VapC family toxin [Anaerolineales bacterium]